MRLLRFTSLPVLLAVAAAAAALLAVPAAARASARPVLRLSLAAEKVTVSELAQFSFRAQGLPSGSRIVLQFRPSGAGGSWTYGETLHGPAGTAQAPALPAGLYRLRIRALRHDRQVAVSAFRYLDVTAVPPSSGCGACTVVGPAAGAVIGWILTVLF